MQAALLKKEWKRFTGSAVYLLNTGIGILFLPVLTALLAVKYSDIKSAMEPMGVAHLLPLLCFALPAMVASMDNTAAPSISLEGNTLWRLKSLPIPPWQILKA